LQFAIVDGPQATARFGLPRDITLLPDGSLAVVDQFRVLRRVTRQGTVSTIAGTLTASGYQDAVGAAALFRGVQGIAADSTGTIYVADRLGRTVRKILPTGSVITIAGRPFRNGDSPPPPAQDGTGSAAVFDDPRDITVDENGILYVQDGSNASSIRRVTGGGIVTTISSAKENAGFPQGAVLLRRFNSTGPMMAGRSGVLYLAELGVIQRGSPAGSWLQRYPDGTAGLLFVAGGFSSCQVQRTTSLTTPWTSLGPFIAEPSGAVSFTDFSPPAGHAFYRLFTLSTR